jgi:hypothetical protein
MGQSFGQRKVYILETIYYYMATGAKDGEAYGIFYCGEPAAAVQKELPFAREAAEVPDGLVLKLTEGLDELKDPRLTTFATLARGANLNFVLAANCPNLDNKGTASELAAVFRMLHALPLYKNGEPLRAEVVYDNGNGYVTFD